MIEIDATVWKPHHYRSEPRAIGIRTLGESGNYQAAASLRLPPCPERGRFSPSQSRSFFAHLALQHERYEVREDWPRYVLLV